MVRQPARAISSRGAMNRSRFTARRRVIHLPGTNAATRLRAATHRQCNGVSRARAGADIRAEAERAHPAAPIPEAEAAAFVAEARHRAVVVAERITAAEAALVPAVAEEVSTAAALLPAVAVAVLLPAAVVVGSTAVAAEVEDSPAAAVVVAHTVAALRRVAALRPAVAEVIAKPERFSTAPKN
jgi:hypothetical protein